MTPTESNPATLHKPLRPARLVLTILLILLAISAAAQWYSSHVILPRYCDDPALTLQQVTRLLTEKRPAGEGNRKPYIIAARITFLLPRGGDEPLEEYLERLHGEIQQQCQ